MVKVLAAGKLRRLSRKRGIYFLVTRLLQFLSAPTLGAALAIQGYTALHLFLTGLALLSALCFVLARPPRAPDAVVPQVETG